MYIDTQESLQKLCDKLSSADKIFFDTEFIRERTFYPNLCLVQIGVDNELYAVDPLQVNVQPLLELLVSCETLLVLHSGRQDLEILYNATGKLPRNVFDTQIAATVCGFGEQVGYQQLVGRLAGQDIDKSQRFTDWSKRPLSAQQIDYALKDVEYLPGIYEKLNSQIEKEGRKKWLLEDEKALLDVKSYEEDPDNAWTKIKSKNKRHADVTVLRELAKWRDNEAKTQNKPRRRIVSDDILIEFAIQKPKTAQALERFRKIGNVSRETMQTLQDIVIKADELPKELHQKGKRPQKDSFDEEVLDLLKLLLKFNSTKMGVVPKLIASSEDLASFVRGEEVQFLEGWRYTSFGQDAEKLLSGDLSFKVNGNKFEVVRKV
jgi:ribonuclease D